MGCAAHAATQLRHPLARAEYRYSCDPGFARTFQARHHGALHPSGHQHHPPGHEPSGQAHAASAEEGRAASVTAHVARPALEVADIFRDHGAAWRQANRGHVSLLQLKVMSAIENCRTAALGGHVARCEDCAHTTIAYNSCRNRHCPKCQGAAAREWMAARAAELLPVPYFHVVFTLPSAIGDIAYRNKAVIYDLLFAASAETMLAIAADPKHLGARIGITSVLHTWGSAMTHHPHVHMIVPGGGISLDASRWIAKRPDFFLPVRVLSKLFHRLMIERLLAGPPARQLTFHGAHAALGDTKAFAAYLAPLKRTRWFVYAKRPFEGPKAVLAYLSRYTHRVAISNRRLIAADAKAVTFKVKDYRIDGPGR